MSIPAPLPLDEPLRLRALGTAALPPTLGPGVSGDERFARIARLAATMIGTPEALVTLVEADVQTLLARVASGPDAVPRRISFCPHVVASGEMLVVEDAMQDVRFADNPLVTAEGGIRFYAGVPLRSPEGHTFGAVCVIAPSPRSLAPAEAQLLQDLASVASDELRLFAARERLMQTTTRLHHIVRMASHDLRGALGSVLSYADTLRDLLPAGTLEADFAATIADVSRHAGDLVRGVLDVALMESGSVEVRTLPIDLVALARDVAGAHRPRAAAKRQTLTLSADAERVLVCADATRTRQVLDNLVSNAVKFTPEGGAVTVAVTADGAFAVEDDGPGIPAAFAESVFAPFASLPNTPTGGEPSVGLGLSIAAQLMALQGGTLTFATPASGRGARFAVTLPLALEGGEA